MLDIRYYILDMRYEIRISLDKDMPSMEFPMVSRVEESGVAVKF